MKIENMKHAVIAACMATAVSVVPATAEQAVDAEALSEHDLMMQAIEAQRLQAQKAAQAAAQQMYEQQPGQTEPAAEAPQITMEELDRQMFELGQRHRSATSDLERLQIQQQLDVLSARKTQLQQNQQLEEKLQRAPVLARERLQARETWRQERRLELLSR